MLNYYILSYSKLSDNADFTALIYT